MGYGGGADAFGCAHELEWLFFLIGKKYCRNGAWPSPRAWRRRARGSKYAMMVPSYDP